LLHAFQLILIHHSTRIVSRSKV